jgi:hypothetical protein
MIRKLKITCFNYKVIGSDYRTVCIERLYNTYV